MMSGGERQMRHLAATLVDTMAHELKEELSRILQENEELKSKCSYLELRGSEHRTTCDIGVQCDLFSNEQGFRNSLQGTMEQQKEDQMRADYQNQQYPLNIYGEGSLIKVWILEPALVHKEEPNDVPDSVTPLEKGQMVDHNKLLTAGYMLCPFERVEESEVESAPGEGSSQKISQPVFRVDETMAIEDNVTRQTSLNSNVLSENPIQISDEVSFSMKGASCDSEIDLKEFGLDVQLGVPSPTGNDIRDCPSIIPDPETSPVTGSLDRRPRSCVKQLPCQGTMSPSPSSGSLNLPAKKEIDETPCKQEELEQDICGPCLTASLPRGYFSEDAELSGLHQVYKEMEENVVPSAAEGLEPPLSELPKSKSMEPRKPSHNPEQQEVLLNTEGMNPQISTLDALDKTSSHPKMTAPAQTQNTAGFTSSNAPLTPIVSISSVSTQMKAACLKPNNMVFHMQRTCSLRPLPTTLTKVQPSTVASTQSPSATIGESCLVSKTLPLSSASSSSSNKAFTKGRTVEVLRQVAQEGASAAPISLNNDPVLPHPEMTKTMFFTRLSMAPVVHRQEKESLNDGVDCVVAETATQNTRRRVRKGHVKRLEEAGPAHSAETTSKLTEDVPEVEHLETDEYWPDKAGELAQKPDAASPKDNDNKPTPYGLKGVRLVTNKLSPSAKKCKLNPDNPRPKESVGLVNTALKTIKTGAVWTPPILEDGKLPQGNDSRCDRLPTKWSTTYATPKRLASPRLVTRKHRPPPTSRPPAPSAPFSVGRERLVRNQCEQCGRVLSSKAALQKHTRLHTGKKLFPCTLCSQSFPDPKALTQHGRVHRNGKIYICSQCNEGFAYRFGLTQHLQMVHSRIKPFVCHICQKSYFRRKDFESHSRVHAGNARQFPCGLCDKRFNRRVELDVHLRSHSREKRHRCSFCEKEFLDYNNLKRHKYTHTGERPFSCAHCTKSFVQSGHLKKHLRNVHKVDVYADLQ